MNFAAAVGLSLEWLLRLLNPAIKTTVLEEQHVAAAADLLSREFCKREPLCKVLGIEPSELTPFFTQLVGHVARERLGVVALDRQQVVRGVLTVEDHLHQFVPSDLVMTDGLAKIGAYLELTQVPQELVGQRRGQLYYCGLAAVHSSHKKSAVLLMLILFNYKYLRRLGYAAGYAKVTNPGITRRLRQLERLARSSVFTAVATTRPADFCYQGTYPFKSYQGATWLFTWRLP